MAGQEGGVRIGTRHVDYYKAATDRTLHKIVRAPRPGQAGRPAIFLSNSTEIMHASPLANFSWCWARRSLNCWAISVPCRY